MSSPHLRTDYLEIAKCSRKALQSIRACNEPPAMQTETVCRCKGPLERGQIAGLTAQPCSMSSSTLALRRFHASLVVTWSDFNHRNRALQAYRLFSSGADYHAIPYGKLKHAFMKHLSNIPIPGFNKTAILPATPHASSSAP